MNAQVQMQTQTMAEKVEQVAPKTPAAAAMVQFFSEAARSCACVANMEAEAVGKLNHMADLCKQKVNGCLPAFCQLEQRNRRTNHVCAHRISPLKVTN